MIANLEISPNVFANLNATLTLKDRVQLQEYPSLENKKIKSDAYRKNKPKKV